METKEEAVSQDELRREVIEGLSRPQKSIPSKYFYDERGSELFEAISELEEYYPTRTELAIMEEYIAEMAAAVGPRVELIEPGSGSSRKTRLLLDALNDPAAYVPIDISGEFLNLVVEGLRSDYPELAIRPVRADYTRPFEIDDDDLSYRRRVVYYPGSTIGNFEPGKARAFLDLIANLVGPGGGLLIGVDLKKDKEILEAAYNDAGGVTAEFNRNMLKRMNRELGANFEVQNFDHNAFYNEEEGRIEMHLVSREEQHVEIGRIAFLFREGESIHTENSYKYSVDEFRELAADRFDLQEVWTDSEELFSVLYLETH